MLTGQCAKPTCRCPTARSTRKDSHEAKFLRGHLRPGRRGDRFSSLPSPSRANRIQDWICVDLDRTRNGSRASYKHWGRYVVEHLEPIYA
jgi:hypothetical protein